jgi:hypothetical protein
MKVKKGNCLKIDGRAMGQRALGGPARYLRRQNASSVVVDGLHNYFTGRREEKIRTMNSPYLHDKTSILSVSRFQHKIERQFTGKFDQPIIPGFGYDQNTLYVGSNAGATL